MSGFTTRYRELLHELDRPDYSKIKLLRELAREHARDMAPHVVSALTSHIMECAPSKRLAAMYMLDCLMKNEADPYSSLFQPSILSVFQFVWNEARADPALRKNLIKLAGTWDTQRTLPPPLMASIQLVIQTPMIQQQTAPHQTLAQSTPTPPPAPITSSPLPAWLPGMPYPQPQPPTQPQQQSILQQPSQQQPQQPPILPQPPPQPQQQSILQPQPPIQTSQQQPILLAPPPLPIPSAGFHTFLASQGWGSLPLPAPQLMMSQGLPTVMLPGGQLLQLPTAAPVASQQQPVAAVPPQNLAAVLASMSAQFGAGGHTPLPQAAAETLNAFTASQQSHQQGAAGYAAAAQTQQQQQPPRITQHNIKEFCQPAVDQLLSASDATRSRFLDLQFLRNRRAKNATHRSRAWFSTVEQWLEGTRAEQQGPGTGFFAEENEQAAGGNADTLAEPVPQLVEEDPSQPTCAISGESFERMYDPDTDKWYYEDAVVLSGEQAASAGVMEGSIVKVHCLAGAPSLTASLGLGPAQPHQAQQGDDVTPALIDAAAEASTAVPAAAGVSAKDSAAAAKDSGVAVGSADNGGAENGGGHQQGEEGRESGSVEQGGASAGAPAGVEVPSTAVEENGGVRAHEAAEQERGSEDKSPGAAEKRKAADEGESVTVDEQAALPSTADEAPASKRPKVGD